MLGAQKNPARFFRGGARTLQDQPVASRSANRPTCRCYLLGCGVMRKYGRTTV